MNRTILSAIDGRTGGSRALKHANETCDIKSVECTPGVKYRNENTDGSDCVGPAHHIHRKLAERGMAGFGRILGVFYAVGNFLGDIGIGNVLRSRQAYMKHMSMIGLLALTACGGTGGSGPGVVSTIHQTSQSNTSNPNVGVTESGSTSGTVPGGGGAVGSPGSTSSELYVVRDANHRGWDYFSIGARNSTFALSDPAGETTFTQNIIADTREQPILPASASSKIVKFDSKSGAKNVINVQSPVGFGIPRDRSSNTFVPTNFDDFLDNYSAGLVTLTKTAPFGAGEFTTIRQLTNAPGQIYVWGSQLTALPTSGKLTYHGYVLRSDGLQSLFSRINGNSPNEIFELEVDIPTRTVGFKEGTYNNTLSGKTAQNNLDVITGKFSGIGFTLKVDGAADRDVSVYGRLTGHKASGVIGVWHTRDGTINSSGKADDGVLVQAVGGFVGARKP